MRAKVERSVFQPPIFSICRCRLPMRRSKFDVERSTPARRSLGEGWFDVQYFSFAERAQGQNLTG